MLSNEKVMASDLRMEDKYEKPWGRHRGVIDADDAEEVSSFCPTLLTSLSNALFKLRAYIMYARRQAAVATTPTPVKIVNATAEQDIEVAFVS